MGPGWQYFFKAHLGVINPEVRNTAYIIIRLLHLGRLCQNKAAVLQGMGMDLDKATIQIRGLCPCGGRDGCPQPVATSHKLSNPRVKRGFLIKSSSKNLVEDFHWLSLIHMPISEPISVVRKYSHPID